VLTGTVPPGCGDDFYERLIRRADQPVLVDAQRTQLLNAARARPLLVKINRDELKAVKGIDGQNGLWSRTARGV